MKIQRYICLVKSTWCEFGNATNKDNNMIHSFSTGLIIPLEWDDFVPQEQLKSLMYVDRSLSGDPNKEELVYEYSSKFACV